jgi:hypothetical protein
VIGVGYEVSQLLYEAKRKKEQSGCGGKARDGAHVGRMYPNMSCTAGTV